MNVREWEVEGYLSEKKTYEWAKYWFDKIVSNAVAHIVYANLDDKTVSESGRLSIFDKIYKYFLFHGSDVFFANEFKHINTKSFFVTDSDTNQRRLMEYSFPTPIRNINNIKPIILQLYGEQIARPFNFSVQNVSKDAVRVRDEAFINAWIKQNNIKLKKSLIEAGVGFTNAQEIEQEYQNMPTNIVEYMNLNYKDKYASAMQALMNVLYHQYNIKEQTDSAFLDLCIFNEEIYLINLENPIHKVQKVNPLNCVYDTQYSNVDNQDPSWFVLWDFLDLNECIGRFHLTDEQVLALERCSENHTFYNANNQLDLAIYSQFNSEFMSEKFLVYYGLWKAIKGLEAIKVDNEYIIKDLDEYHKKEFNRLMKDPKYKKKKETLHFQQIWEGIRIGSEVYVQLRPLPYQPRSNENLKATKLPVSITKLEGRSLVDDMKNIDFLLKILWHKVEYLLSQAKGSILVYDLSYIPRSYNYDLDKVIYHLNTEGMLLYNSKEDGMINNAGNMINSYDLGISQTLGMVIQLIQVLESKLEDVAGVNKQRMAQISGKDSLGVTKAALNQSILRTEYLYRAHNISLKNLLTILCDYAKEFYKNSEKEISFMYTKIGELQSQIVRILPENLMSDYAIFVNDVTRETQIFDSIKLLAQMFIQQGMLDVQSYINILESENLQIAKAKLKLHEDRKKEELREQQKSQQEGEMQLLQMKQQHELNMIEANAKVNKEAAEIQERSEMTIQVEKLKIEQQRLQMEAEKLQTEREKLQAQMQNEIAKLELQADIKQKETEANLSLEQLKQNTELKKLELQARIDKLLKEMELNAKRELEYVKMAKETELKKIEAQHKGIEQQQQNLLNVQGQQKELQAKQQILEGKIAELDIIKQRIQDYENRLLQEGKMLQEYMKLLDNKALVIEKELENIRKDKIKIEKEKTKIETEQPKIEGIDEEKIKKNTPRSDDIVSLEELGIE
ncbi:MAG: hypothetical protein RML94_00170 [Bacteroidia bacterium]|nr:hypothetical protein [Bacteroidia bacterium]